MEKITRTNSVPQRSGFGKFHQHHSLSRLELLIFNYVVAALYLDQTRRKGHFLYHPESLPPIPLNELAKSCWSFLETIFFSTVKIPSEDYSPPASGPKMAESGCNSTLMFTVNTIEKRCPNTRMFLAKSVITTKPHHHWRCIGID
jgi:hypothetical protein